MSRPVQTRSEPKVVSPPFFSLIRSNILQRQCACGQHTSAGGECEECKQKREGALQRAAITPSTVPEVPSIVHEVLHSPGHPLDTTTRAFMEPRFGQDFSGVRVHTDTKAAESARVVNALAYTVGRNVVFGLGQYAPHLNAGRKLMVHELTHVIQQQGAANYSPANDLQIGAPDGAAEREAGLAASDLLSRESFSPSRANPTGVQISRQIDPLAERASPGGKPTQRPGSPLPYREATELAECIRIMGDDSRDYCRETVLGEKPLSPVVSIERQGGDGQSFISTDTITLTATVSSASGGPAPSAPINWTVTGVSADAGNGNPHTAKNKTQFSFKPNPSKRPKTGSRSPNDPIEYRVDADAGGGSSSFSLIQDETDIIRQEYIDLGPVTPPARTDIVTPTIATYNTGNYSLIVDGGMDNALTSTETEFQTLTPKGSVAPAISVSSGYRNPRRNVAAGSQFPVGSRHVWGKALDLTVPGANATLWARLRLAGTNAGNSSICEVGPTQVPCDDASVNHVHIQW
jgi:hypothetical protein